MRRVGEKNFLQKKNYPVFLEGQENSKPGSSFGVFFFLSLIERAVSSEKAGRGFTSSCVKDLNLKTYSFVVRTNSEKARALLIDVGLTTL